MLGCGEWVLIDVPGVSLDEIFPFIKRMRYLCLVNIRVKLYGDIYKIDYQYLHWLEKQTGFSKLIFEELKQLYPGVEKQGRCTLMVLQVVMILAVTQSNITLFGKQQLLNTVLIDHVSAIVRRGGSAACLMDSFQLCAVGCISIGNRATITKSYYTRQI